MLMPGSFTKAVSLSSRDLLPILKHPKTKCCLAYINRVDSGGAANQNTDSAQRAPVEPFVGAEHFVLEVSPLDELVYALVSHHEGSLMVVLFKIDFHLLYLIRTQMTSPLIHCLNHPIEAGKPMSCNIRRDFGLDLRLTILSTDFCRAF